MRKMIFFICILIMISGCSAQGNATNLYKKEQPIEVTIDMSATKGDLGTITAVLTQNGKPLVNPDFVHFEIWNQEGTVEFGMEEAVSKGNGIYQMTKPFKVQGLYFVKVHASSNGSMIMPTKQFVIGALTEEDKEYLSSHKESTVTTPEGHH